MIRNPRIAVLMAAMMLVSACVTFTPRVASGFPIKLGDTIGEPDEPGIRQARMLGGNSRAAIGGFALTPIGPLVMSVPVQVAMQLLVAHFWPAKSTSARRPR
jgi:hypothetical protein